MEKSETVEVLAMLNRLRSIMNSGSVLGYFLQAVPIVCVVGILYGIVRARAAKRGKGEWGIMKLLFACYLAGLISLVVLPANFWLRFFDGVFFGWWEEMLPIFRFGGFHLTPSLLKVLSGELVLGSWVKTMLVGNVVMFLPFGFFLPFVTEKFNGKNIFAIAAAVPVAVELLQTVFDRSFDVDDLICNFIGIVAGFFIGFAIKTMRQKRER